MKKFLVTIAVLLQCLNASLEAKTYFDYEADPLPLVKIDILVPASRLTHGDTENLALRFLEEFYESGTQTLNRQQLQDALASYGANLSINPSYQYADISVTFPLNKGKIPNGLSQLVKALWDNPRITKENFERAKKFLKANHLSLLDRDSSLLNLGIQKLTATALFGLSPYSTETFSKIKLENIQSLQKNYYRRDGDIWVGVIGPAEQKKEIANLVKSIFPDTGAIEEGVLKEKLLTGYQPEQKGLLKPTFLIIDKKDLAQIHYGFVRIENKKQNSKSELVDNFNFYILSGAGGVESVYGKKIRGEKGLAYSVSGMMSSYYEYPIISLYANPQRNKQAEAFEVLDQLIQDTFKDAKIISSLNDKMWDGWLMAFKNSERQSGITPEGRIDRRKSIATGDLSYALYKSSIDNWNVKKANSGSRLQELSKNSSMLVSAIGDAREIEPLVKKYFPTYNVRKISYKDVISSGWLTKAN